MYVDKDGLRWYKGNVHAHSDASDGALPFGEVVARYRGAGYDFLAVTDHWRMSETVESEGFLLLSGCEYSFAPCAAPDAAGRALTSIGAAARRAATVHINAIGCARAPGIQNTPGLTQRHVVDKIHEAGGIAIFNHPEWSRNLPDDVWAAGDLDGIEIYNSFVNHEYAMARHSDCVADQVAFGGRLLPVFATDDAHYFTGEECGAFIMVQSGSLSRAGILGAIRERRFCASQGPWATAEEFGGTVKVACSPVDRISLVTNAPCGLVQSGRGMVSHEFALPDTASYYRVEVMDARGNAAWTQPAPRRANS
jgi:hypothetical protein